MASNTSGPESESVAGRPGSVCPSDVVVASNNNTKEKKKRKFMPHQLKTYGWLKYNEEKKHSKYSKDSLGFQLGLIDSGLGLMIFHEMSPRTHYQQIVTKSLLYTVLKTTVLNWCKV